MSGFSAEWLALRESADRSARVDAFVERSGVVSGDIVDLGSGTGSNFRWLAPLLGGDQHWVLVDHDAALLQAAVETSRKWADMCGFRSDDRRDGIAIIGQGFSAAIRTLQLDLSAALDALELRDGCLVTASALFDLVSREWLERLVARIAASRASVLWTLSYDGGIAIEPMHDLDRRIVSLVNRHQRTDKGFGPALGPDAWRLAAALLGEAGLDVATAPSPWSLGSEDGELLVPLIAGWAEAAIEIAPDEADAIRRWCSERLDAAEAGELAVTVGHRDLVARPR